MSSDSVELLVGGVRFDGWLEASVTRAMDAAAGSFSLSVTDRWSHADAPWRIVPGEACEIRIGGEVVITGYVDSVEASFASGSHSLSAQGRDRSADMVDCAAVHKPDTWKGLTLLQLAQTLAKPFGITVRAEVDVGAALPEVKLQHGETALEALVRHARMRKVLVMPDGRGGVLLTRTGVRHAAVELVQGRNLIEASGTLDFSERFSEYIVKGQSRSKANTDSDSEAHARARVTDAYIKRYRPLVIVASGEVTNATAKERATWEANTRLGKSAQASATVQGWRQTPGGALWEPNLLVMVRAPWLSLEGEMLVKEVTFTKGGGGTTTDLELVSPQAFEPEPPDGKQTRKAKGDSIGGELWVLGSGEAVRPKQGIPDWLLKK